MRPFVRVVVVAAVVLAAFATNPGCRRGGYVWVQQDRYIPNLPVELQAYRDRPVMLAEFVNQAQNTSTWYYYSPDEMVTYEGSPTIADYLRDCFAKAMTSLGMVVLTDPLLVQDPSVATLQATIYSWDDYALHVQILLTKYGQPVYQQEYRVEVQRIATMEPMVLEDRAYRINDMVVGGVLSDPGFQAAFFQ